MPEYEYVYGTSPLALDVPNTSISDTQIWAPQGSANSMFMTPDG